MVADPAVTPVTLAAPDPVEVTVAILASLVAQVSPVLLVVVAVNGKDEPSQTVALTALREGAEVKVSTVSEERLAIIVSGVASTSFNKHLYVPASEDVKPTFE